MSYFVFSDISKQALVDILPKACDNFQLTIMGNYF